MFCMVMHCDACKNHSQPVKFDDPNESFADLLGAFANAGWRIEVNGAEVLRSECPSCASMIADLSTV